MSGATATRVPIAQALPIARAFVLDIAPYCERVEIAGSIRRGATMVGDIEIVAVPKMETVEHVDMFGETVSSQAVDLLDLHVTAMAGFNRVAKRPLSDGSTRFGPSLKYLIYQGMPLDLFSPAAERFGWILLLRTGPAEFSRQLVVERGSKTKDRRPGLLPSRLKPVDGWLTERVSGRRLWTPDEQAVFYAFGLPYREPTERR